MSFHPEAVHVAELALERAGAQLRRSAHTLRAHLDILDVQAQLLAAEGRLTLARSSQLTKAALSLRAHLRPGALN